ncbi:MAG: sodium-dependent transporter [Phycisphaerae bacterium]|nr:sodium-dependent transporter [Phycisphaerae bacterium]
MTEPIPRLRTEDRENWGSKLGVVLAVAGSAVGLGNFLRFPGQAVNNGAGAFMVPYIISFLLLGIPICWCEWTMGRLGGRRGMNSPPGVLSAVWNHPIARFIGALQLMLPVVIYMYYVFVESWCLYYSAQFFTGAFDDLFANATAADASHADVVTGVVGASGAFFADSCGLGQHGRVFTQSGLWMLCCVAISFGANFALIYRGVTRGIEAFCKVAMPLLILCALIILVRVLTLPNISAGLGFMWNPDWPRLADPSVWLAAAGQIFFSLSLGFGLILTYASYLRAHDDVVLSGLSASSANEFCEVVLAGLIVVPTAFLFLGPENAKGSTFGLGFITLPSIMHFMPGGRWFGGLWFGLLWLAALTSSLSMLQPAIAFLEQGFGLRRRASVAVLGLVTLAGALPIMYFTKDAVALDHADFWVSQLMIYIAATGQVLIFGWVLGTRNGIDEATRGAELALPPGFAFIIKYITPSFLIIVFVAWVYTHAPDYVRGMMPSIQGPKAARAVYEAAAYDKLGRQWLRIAPDADLPAQADLDTAAAETVTARLAELLGSSPHPATDQLPDWLLRVRQKAEESRTNAEEQASIARAVFVCLVLFLIVTVALSQLTYRRRMASIIAHHVSQEEHQP